MAVKNDYSKYINEKTARKEMSQILEIELGRPLTELERRKINWLADQEYETVGVFIDIFKELGKLQ